MSYIVKSGSIDITDYVIGCSAVPLIQRNRNYEPVISEITMVISGKVSHSLVQTGDEIKIASALSQPYPFFIGIISESKYDKAETVFRLQVRSKLYLLQNQLINYQNLHSALSAGATLQQYRAVDNQGYPSVQLTWILERMFAQISIELKLPNPTSYIQTINFGGVNRLIQLQHLRVDENMLYCINQSTAQFHTTIDADPEKRVLVPTWWDFFCWFVRSIGNTETDNIGYSVRWSTSGTPEQLELFSRDDTAITVDDDFNYGEENSNIVGEEGGYSYNAMFTSRIHYAETPEYALGEVKNYTVDGKNLIDFPMSFIIMYEKYWEAEGYIVGGLAQWPLYAYPPTAFLYNKIRAAIGDYNIKEWNTITTPVTRAKEFLLDMDTRTAQLVEEIE